MDRQQNNLQRLSSDQRAQNATCLFTKSTSSSPSDDSNFSKTASADSLSTIFILFSPHKQTDKQTDKIMSKSPAHHENHIITQIVLRTKKIIKRTLTVENYYYRQATWCAHTARMYVTYCYKCHTWHGLSVCLCVCLPVCLSVCWSLSVIKLILRNLTTHSSHTVTWSLCTRNQTYSQSNPNPLCTRKQTCSQSETKQTKCHASKGNQHSHWSHFW